MCMVEKSVAWLATSEQRRFHIIAFRATISTDGMPAMHPVSPGCIPVTCRREACALMKLTPEILEAFR